MNQNPAYQRALILQQQGRYSDAAQELRQAIGMDPHAAILHSMLALCLVEQKQFREATAEAQQAIGLEPELAFAHYVLARVAMDRQRPADAAQALSEAVRLDPYQADYWSLLAAIRFEQRGWPSALEAAEHGLQLDPDHPGCQNLRAMALIKLGRHAEAGDTIGEALRNDPENALTHANEGWRLLHAGQPKPAMQHFREALRLDPLMDWARSGIVEALKARNFLYRWMLAYFLWTARLSRQAQWGIVLGGYFGFKLLRGVAEGNPALGTWIWPLLYLYIAFAALTWLADPMFNLMLRLHPFGKHALSNNQKRTANLIGILLLTAIVTLIASLVRDDFRLQIAALVTAGLMLPASVIFKCAMPWPRLLMAGITVALAAIGGIAVVLLFTLSGDDSSLLHARVGQIQQLLNVFMIGLIASPFGANYLLSVRPRH